MSTEWGVPTPASISNPVCSTRFDTQPNRSGIQHRPVLLIADWFDLEFATMPLSSRQKEANQRTSRCAEEEYVIFLQGVSETGTVAFGAQFFDFLSSQGI